MILREIVTKLGFQIEEEKLLEYEKQISQIKSTINTIGSVVKKAAYAITGAATSMTLLSAHTAKSVEQTEELAKKFGVTSEEMQRLEIVANATGVSVEKLNESMNSGNGKAIRAQSDELLKLAYIVNSKGVESSKKFLNSWAEFKIIIGSIKRELSVKFMPVFTNLMNKFKDWYVSNRKLISQNISSFINILTIALRGLLLVIQIIMAPVNGLINLFGGLDNAVSVLSISLAFALSPAIATATGRFLKLTAAMLTNPLTWLIVGLAALGLAIALFVTDLWNWAKGNDSVTGYVIKTWTEFWKMFKWSFNGVVDSVTSYFKDSFQALGDWFGGFFDDILDVINKVKNTITGVHNSAHERAYAKSFGKSAANNNLTAYQKALIAGDAVIEDISKSPFAKLNIEPADLSSLSPVSASQYSMLAGSSPALSSNNVKQYITENITVNVPVGTSSEQSKAIADQVADLFQIRFDSNMQIGIDSMSRR